MKRVTQTLILGCGLLSMVGCSELNHQDIGTVTGGIAGGLLGSTMGGGSGRLLAIGAGTLAGAYLGGAVGRSMDQQDQLKAQLALEHNRSHQASTWRNPDNGNCYTVIPKKTYRQHHRYCREYTLIAEIAGKKQQTYGKACREPDGTWKIQN